MSSLFQCGNTYILNINKVHLPVWEPGLACGREVVDETQYHILFSCLWLDLGSKTIC